jgi:hypothetical protein
MTRTESAEPVDVSQINLELGVQVSRVGDSDLHLAVGSMLDHQHGVQLADVRAVRVAAVVDADVVGLRRLLAVHLDVSPPSDHISDLLDAPGIAGEQGPARRHPLGDDTGSLPTYGLSASLLSWPDRVRPSPR